MKRACVIAALCGAMCSLAAGAGAIGPAHTKILPSSVDYPLVRPVPYKGIAPDIYAKNFGVVRMFRSSVARDFVKTVLESWNYTDAYGSYGVLGRGEDVFTHRAARFRRLHQGP